MRTEYIDEPLMEVDSSKFTDSQLHNDSKNNTNTDTDDDDDND